MIGNGKHERCIIVDLGCFMPSVEMIINVPNDRDDEEYIDEILDSILNVDLRYNCDWEFK